MPHGGRRSADDRLLALLACGVTVEAAAQQAGVGAATVYRRLKDRRFRRRLQQVRADFVQRTAGTMTAVATEAVRTLVELLKVTSPAPVRLGAARAVLEIGMKVREVADLEERMAALEERLEAGDATRGR
jgi:hypothetical protein